MNKTVIALDVGSKRIGMSFAGDGLSVARSMPTIENNQTAMDVIQHIITERSVDTLVVGLPRSLDGDETPQTAYVRQFTKDLEQTCGIKAVFQDEALSSRQAEASLAKMGKGYKKGDVDSLAAQTILQDYLDQGVE